MVKMQAPRAFPKLDMCCRFGPYFVSPVIAGLQPDLTPYLAGTDSIGAIETAKDFMVAGTAPDSLLGMCESMWRPDMVNFAQASIERERYIYISILIYLAGLPAAGGGGPV